MSYLKIDGMNKHFDGINVLKDISFEINKGEFVSLLGPSGCGKTTLLRIISGIEYGENGRIFLNENEITTLAPVKRNFGMVFQSYVLFPNMTAEKNIEYVLKHKGMSKKETKEKVEEVLSLVGLNSVKTKYPNELSGGQQQRIALARAIAFSPSMLLLDEPLSALDAKVRERLRREIKHIHEKLGITTIMVTHDQEEALTMADKIIVMKDAEIVQIGTPEEIYKFPKNKFVADFIGNVNLLHKDGCIHAIRPEDIQYSFCEKDGYVTCKIKSIEFRGSFYRLILELKDKVYDTKEVLFDLLAMEKEKNEISRDMKLYINFQNYKVLSD